MISPIKTQPKPRRFATYDLEWYPDTLELRLIGVYDGTSYKCYTRISDFLSEWLRHDSSGIWLYAHAGGLYDFQFLLRCLKESGYELEASFSGSSAIVVKISDGTSEWYLLDSYWLLRSSLRSIGEWTGRLKGDCAFDAPLPELIEYNEQDCKILWHAISIFEDLIAQLGGELQRTIASTAINLFRRRYLKRTIKTNPGVNSVSRSSYIASRVEVFQTKCNEAFYYDINSSFPHAMLKPLPANVLAWEKKLPRQKFKFLADCTIRIPESEIPPLPYRDSKHRVFFPWGTWRSWFTDTDINVLVQNRGNIEKVHSCYVFDEFTDLAEYVTDIYELRKKASGEAEKYILKILLNSLYGKFGERKLKEKMLVNATKKTLKRFPSKKLVAQNIYLIEHESSVPHEWVPIAADITARARANLYNHLIQCKETYYCDTDGFACSRSDNFTTSSRLGGLKLEKILTQGHFAAPKLYAMKEEAQDWKIKAKGFSKVKRQGQERSTGLTYNEFQELLLHRSVEVETFTRVRSTIKTQDLFPAPGTLQKTWRGKIRPKRCELADGTTRPWTVEELNEKWP